MDKLKLAHDYAMKHIQEGWDINYDVLVVDAWQYADAMQAKAKEREDKARPDVLLTKDKDGKCLHFHHEFGHKKCMDCGASLGEWQPDWSKAPEWANWWAIDGFGDKKAHWYRDKPYLDDDSVIEDEWNADLDPQKDSFVKAPSFDYQGSWQDSLRKRPDSLCEVDWSQSPNDAIGWVIFDGVSTWLGESGYLIEDAPSFGFTGSHIVERPDGF